MAFGATLTAPARAGQVEPRAVMCKEGMIATKDTAMTVALEETIAHLTRVVDELSDVVARQETEIAVIKRRLQMVMEREAEREFGEGSSIPLADQKPPHY